MYNTTEIYDGNKNNIEMDKLEKQKHQQQEIYEKNIQKELEQQQQQHQQQQQQQQQQQHQQQQQQQQLNLPPNPQGINQPPPPPPQQQNGLTLPKDTTNEQVDVTTVPPTTSDNNLNVCMPNKVSPTINGTNDVSNQVYNREIHPPSSIYGIESLTSKPYDGEQKIILPDSLHSPRYQNGNHIPSPHHSSPERERRVQRQDPNASWVSPLKPPHNYRNPCPPASPYLDARDPAYPPRDPNYPPRRYVPPLYGNGNRNFMHPNERNRYGAYPMGSPLMPTLGYPREPLDARCGLHMPTNLGFEEDKFKLSPPSIDDKHIWTKQEVELLLDLYEEHKIKLQDPRVRKTKVWEDIAKQIHEKLDADVNGCQCNQKFRNMKADYQKVVEHNARSGSFRKTCKYFDRLEKLLTPVNETEKLKDEVDNETKYFNHINFTNGHAGFGSKVGTPNENGFYERELSRSSSSPDSANQNYSNCTGSTNTPNSPEKRPLNHIENSGDDSSPPPPKMPRNECNCSAINKKELIDVLKEYLKEQRKREEETIHRIQALHKEKIDTVVKFLDLFQELVKKV